MNIYDILGDMLDQCQEELDLFYFYRDCADNLSYWRNPLEKFKMSREAANHLALSEEILADYYFVRHASLGD